MATIVKNFEDVKQWKILPLDRVNLKFKAANGDVHSTYLKYLEASSSVDFVPIVRPNDTGGERIVAFEVSASLAMIQDNYGDMSTLMYDITNCVCEEVLFILEPPSTQQNGETMWINLFTTTGECKAISVTYKIEARSISPVLTIEIKAQASKNIIERTTNKPITQLWSST